MLRQLALPFSLAAMVHLASATTVRADDAGATASGALPLEFWSGERAMADIRHQLLFTPRSLDTPGHAATIEYIKAELAKTTAEAAGTQSWRYRHDDGTERSLTNIVGRFDTSNPRRVILGTHYDSIVRAYNDATHPAAPMPGANNSASGVALLLETARVLRVFPKLPVGVDLVFFDGEEGPLSLGAGDPDWKPLGSPHFAADLRELYPDRLPEQAIIFDMVCYEALALNPELASLGYAKPQVTKFWEIGRAIAPSVFRPEPTEFVVADDQMALAAAGIPSFLVIDFKYDPWFNTTRDTIDKCAATSLEAVGRTLLRYLYSL